jgi:hypothetical protein
MRKYHIVALLLLLVLTAGNAVSQHSVQPILLDFGELHLTENVLTMEEHFAHVERREGIAHRLIQFRHVPTLSQHEKLKEQGIQLQEYVPYNAYVASVPVRVKSGTLSGLGVWSVAELPLQMKVLQRLRTEQTSGWQENQKKLEVVIKVYEDLDVFSISNKLSDLIDVTQIIEHANLIYANVVMAEIEEIAGHLSVRYVDLAPEPGEPEHDLGRTLHRANMLSQGYIGGRNYDGSGVSVAVNDDGFVGPHIDFTGRTEQSDVTGDFTGGHGDMVAGILGGAGNLDPTMRGMAPGAFIHIRQYDAALPNTVTLHQNDQVMIFNSSYGNGCNDGYTSLTEQVDDEISNNPALIQVFSCGNSGGSDCGYGAGGAFGNITGGHKIGKNVIATANLDESDNLQSSSSRGPSADGRLKPDLAANGFEQFSTDPDNSYSPGGGTSAASPGIAGVAALLYNAYRELNGGSDPNSGLIKACMLNTAEDLGNPGPDYSFGWGRVNAHKAVTVIEEQNYILDSITSGSTNTHAIAVPSGVAEIRVMLYWMEEGGSPSSSIVLINDLDVTVEEPGGLLHRPLVLDPTPNVSNLSADAVQGRDSLNNVEQVRINTIPSGTYSVHVEGYSVPFGQQKYYILWEFIYEDITLTYPSGGESFVPGEQEVIRWDSYSDTGFFSLDYSIDGGVSWNAISSSVPGGAREYNWAVPSGPSERALFRVSRGATADTSEAEFVISETPENVILEWVCPDSLLLKWDMVPGALQYEVSKLGTMYMDSIGRTASDSMVVHGVDYTQEDWFSVRTVFPNGGMGRRANAVQKMSGISNCALQFGIEVAAIESPVAGTFFNCHNTGSVPIMVRVTNVGLNPIDSIPLSVQLDGGAITTELFLATLNPGVDSTFVFSATLDFPSNGIYQTVVWSDHPLDQFNGDDTANVETVVSTSATLTGVWMQDFESFGLCGALNDCGATICNLSGGWRNESSSSIDDNDWRVDNDGTPSSGTGPDTDHTLGNSIGKYLFTEASGGCLDKEAILITPCLDFSTMGAPFLSFWYHMQGFSMGSLTLDVFNGVEYDLDIWSLSGDQGGIWQQANVDLSAYAGGLINLRFRGVTGDDYQSDIALDDIGITTPFSVPEVAEIKVSIYPNPADQALTLNYSGIPGGGANLSIYNLLGMKVLAKKLDQSTGRVSIATNHLVDGTYVLVVETEAKVPISKIFNVIR